MTTLCIKFSLKLYESRIINVKNNIKIEDKMIIVQNTFKLIKKERK